MPRLSPASEPKKLSQNEPVRRRGQAGEVGRRAGAARRCAEPRPVRARSRSRRLTAAEPLGLASKAALTPIPGRSPAGCRSGRLSSSSSRRDPISAPRPPRVGGGDPGATGARPAEVTEQPPGRATPPPRGWHLPGQLHGRRLPREAARLAPSFSSLPAPLLPAAGRTNPLGHGCKSNLVPPAPPPVAQSAVTAQNGHGTFPARPRGCAATEGVDGTADGAAARRRAHFLCPSLLPLPDSSGNCVITSCHRKPTSRRCKQTNTLCLHPSQNHPIGKERAGANGKGKANNKKKKSANKTETTKHPPATPPQRKKKKNHQNSPESWQLREPASGQGGFV